jgi:hypothetical protein
LHPHPLTEYGLGSQTNRQDYDRSKPNFKFGQQIDVRTKGRFAERLYRHAAQICERMLMRHPNRIELYPKLASVYILSGRQDELAERVKMIFK